MRQKFNPQPSLFTTMARNKIAQELKQMSHVLDATPQISDAGFGGNMARQIILT